MEAEILLWIQNCVRADWLTPLVKCITYLGNAGFIWILLSLMLLLIPRQRRLGCMCASALVFDLLSVNLLVKNLFARTRPYEVIEGLTNLIGKQSDFSFPSGHTAASFAVATVLVMRAPKKLSIPAAVLAVIISLSRLYVGVHYPTDVLGGVFIGILCGVAAVFFVEWREKKIAKKRAQTE